jgi:hypothetical protein
MDNENYVPRPDLSCLRGGLPLVLFIIIYNKKCIGLCLAGLALQTRMFTAYSQASLYCRLPIKQQFRFRRPCSTMRVFKSLKIENLITEYRLDNELIVAQDFRVLNCDQCYILITQLGLCS